MKLSVKKAISLFMAICLLLCMTLPVSARYSDTNSITLNLTFSSSRATCYGKITGRTGTTSITGGTATLTDSDGNVIKTWSNLSATGRTLIFTKYAQGVSSGETYTLSVTATVNRNGSSETVSDSITATY